MGRVKTSISRTMAAEGRARRRRGRGSVRKDSPFAGQGQVTSVWQWDGEDAVDSGALLKKGNARDVATGYRVEEREEG